MAYVEQPDELCLALDAAAAGLLADQSLSAFLPCSSAYDASPHTSAEDSSSPELEAVAGVATQMGAGAADGGAPMRLAATSVELPSEVSPARAPSPPAASSGVAALALHARTLRAWLSRSPAECREQLLDGAAQDAVATHEGLPILPIRRVFYSSLASPQMHVQLPVDAHYILDLRAEEPPHVPDREELPDEELRVCKWGKSGTQSKLINQHSPQSWYATPKPLAQQRLSAADCEYLGLDERTHESVRGAGTKCKIYCIPMSTDGPEYSPTSRPGMGGSAIVVGRLGAAAPAMIAEGNVSLVSVYSSKAHAAPAYDPARRARGAALTPSPDGGSASSGGESPAAAAARPSRHRRPPVRAADSAPAAAISAEISGGSRSRRRSSGGGRSSGSGEVACSAVELFESQGLSVGGGTGGVFGSGEETDATRRAMLAALGAPAGHQYMPIVLLTGVHDESDPRYSMAPPPPEISHEGFGFAAAAEDGLGESPTQRQRLDDIRSVVAKADTTAMGAIRTAGPEIQEALAPQLSSRREPHRSACPTETGSNLEDLLDHIHWLAALSNVLASYDQHAPLKAGSRQTKALLRNAVARMDAKERRLMKQHMRAAMRDLFPSRSECMKQNVISVVGKWRSGLSRKEPLDREE